MTALMEEAHSCAQAQRREALARANRVRAYRKQVKADLAQRRVRLEDVLASEDPMLASMVVFDLLLATPKVGRTKATKALKRAGVSPTRRLAGLTVRERAALVGLL